MDKYTSRQTLIGAALRLVSSQIYADTNAHDPSGDWQCEMDEEIFDSAVHEYAKHLDKPS